MDAIGCVCANAGLIVASRAQSQFIVDRDRVLRLRSSQLSWAPLSDSISDSRLCIMSVSDAKNAAIVAVTLYIHVCRFYLARPLCSDYAVCCGVIVTRGPPTV